MQLIARTILSRLTSPLCCLCSQSYLFRYFGAESEDWASGALPREFLDGELHSLWSPTPWRGHTDRYSTKGTVPYFTTPDSWYHSC